ncbi:MAG TPA: hypothetical protein VIN08_03145 [Ohtaekwangia sp.]|uniref:hypothetical protein n=1 Tax=Ohtaekwangia sp. TaxID=2066019 RepID=UPI002F93F9E8
METKDEGKAEKAFKSFGKRVDEFMVEFNEASEKLRKEFEVKLDELKVSAENFRKEAENKDRWKEVEDNLKKAGDELGNAFKAAFKKKNP